MKTAIIRGSIVGLILGLAVVFKAYAAELPTRSTIIDCGSTRTVEHACAADDRCCQFIEPSAGDGTSATSVEAGHTVYSVEEWSGGDIYRADEVYE